MYKYGEEVNYSIEVLNESDYDYLMKFSCGNKKLDGFFHKEVFVNNKIVSDDGLIFKAINNDNGEIIGIVSLATSGIVFVQTNYMKVLPAIKIDVFAVDLKYQKLHYSKYSEEEENPEEHYYLSDDIMGKILFHCNEISEKYALVNYVLLYADKNARRFYERNGFTDFSEFMEKEKNMEINENIPMYIKLY